MEYSWPTSANPPGLPLQAIAWPRSLLPSGYLRTSDGQGEVGFGSERIKFFAEAQ